MHGDNDGVGTDLGVCGSGDAGGAYALAMHFNVILFPEPDIPITDTTSSVSSMSTEKMCIRDSYNITWITEAALISSLYSKKSCKLLSFLLKSLEGVHRSAVCPAYRRAA